MKLCAVMDDDKLQLAAEKSEQNCDNSSGNNNGQYEFNRKGLEMVKLYNDWKMVLK